MQTFDWYIPKGTSKLQYRQGADIDSFIKSVARPDRDVVGTVTFKVAVRRHSRPQENFRWGRIYPIVLQGFREAGWSHIRTKEDVHREVSRLFLVVDAVNEKTGECTTKIRSTADLDFTTIDEDNFQEDIRRWGAEFLNIQIPFPGEQLKIQD